MPALPTSVSFTGAGITEAQFKTAVTDQREFLAGLLGTTGTQVAAHTALGSFLNTILTKTAAYSVVAADRGKLIDYTTAGFTLTLPTGATAGLGFVLGLKNSAATGVLTIGRNAANIDGAAANITLNPGESCLIVCDGTNWKTVGKTVTPISEILDYTSTSKATLIAAARSLIVSSGADDLDYCEIVVAMTTYTRVHEFRVPVGGSIITRLGISGNDSYASYFKIYKNGTAAGTERSVSSITPTVFYEETFTVSPGDLIQVYAKSTSMPGTRYVFQLWTALTTKFAMAALTYQLGEK